MADSERMSPATQRRLAAMLMSDAEQLQDRAVVHGVTAFCGKPVQRERPNERFLQNTLRNVASANKRVDEQEMWQLWQQRKAREAGVVADRPQNRRWSRSSNPEGHEHAGTSRKGGSTQGKQTGTGRKRHRSSSGSRHLGSSVSPERRSRHGHDNGHDDRQQSNDKGSLEYGLRRYSMQQQATDVAKIKSEGHDTHSTALRSSSLAAAAQGGSHTAVDSTCVSDNTSCTSSSSESDSSDSDAVADRPPAASPVDRLGAKRQQTSGGGQGGDDDDVAGEDAAAGMTDDQVMQWLAASRRVRGRGDVGPKAEEPGPYLPAPEGAAAGDEGGVLEPARPAWLPVDPHLDKQYRLVPHTGFLKGLVSESAGKEARGAGVANGAGAGVNGKEKRGNKSKKRHKEKSPKKDRKRDKKHKKRKKKHKMERADREASS
eukprot:jgi/Chrzof1/13867/Cz08g15170.t1